MQEHDARSGVVLRRSCNNGRRAGPSSTEPDRGPFDTIDAGIRERAERRINRTLEESYAGFIDAILNSEVDLLGAMRDSTFYKARNYKYEKRRLSQKRALN